MRIWILVLKTLWYFGLYLEAKAQRSELGMRFASYKIYLIVKQMEALNTPKEETQAERHCTYSRNQNGILVYGYETPEGWAFEMKVPDGAVAWAKLTGEPEANFVNMTQRERNGAYIFIGMKAKELLLDTAESLDCDMGNSQWGAFMKNG
jgi:hypothetical protein